MVAMRFSEGTKFHWSTATYQVKRLLPARKANIEDVLTGEVQTVEIARLEAALFAGELRFDIDKRIARRVDGGAGQPSATYQSLDDIPPELLAIAQYRLSVIQPLLDMPSGERTRAVVAARAQEVNANIDPAQRRKLLGSASIMGIYRWIRYYTDSGNDLRSLVPSTDRCGNPRQPRIQPEANAILESVIRQRYLVPERVTIDQVMHEVVLRIQEVNANRYEGEKLAVPSRNTIARRIADLDVVEVFAVKQGSLAARRKYKQYGVREKPSLPLERVEIDHTPVDLIVVDDRDNLPLGKLTLTYALDVATGYPLGYNLGWDKTSYLAVAECLRHCIMPKGDIRTRYGTEHEWLAYGIPSVLVTDNGMDFRSGNLREACQMLGIDLERNPVQSPHFKGGVERQIGTANTMLLHGLPGTTRSNTAQRGNYDSARQAAIYLSEIDKIFHIYVADIYAESFNKGIGGIPARRWEQSIAQGFTPRLPASVEELHIQLSGTEHRTVQHYGVEIFNLLYNSQELLPLRIALKGQKTKIKYNPGDLGRIHVYHPFENRYIEAPALIPSYASGLSLWKHKYIVDMARANRDTVDESGLARAYRKLQEIVDAGRRVRRTGTRTKVARFDYGGKPTRELTSADLKEPLMLPPGGLPLVASPQAALPPAPTNIDLDISLDDEAGWGVEYSIRPTRGK